MHIREVRRELKDNGFQYVRDVKHGEFWGKGAETVLIPRAISGDFRAVKNLRRDLDRVFLKVGTPPDVLSYTPKPKPQEETVIEAKLPEPESVKDALIYKRREERYELGEVLWNEILEDDGRLLTKEEIANLFAFAGIRNFQSVINDLINGYMRDAGIEFVCESGRHYFDAKGAKEYAEKNGKQKEIPQMTPPQPILAIDPLPTWAVDFYQAVAKKKGMTLGSLLSSLLMSRAQAERTKIDERLAQELELRRQAMFAEVELQI